MVEYRGVVSRRRVPYGACEPETGLTWAPPPGPGTVLFRLVCSKVPGGPRSASIEPDRRASGGGDRGAPCGGGCPQGAGDACVRVADGGGARGQEVVEFKTTVGGLLVVRDWLKAHGVTQVAMEATSVYWKPVWAVLEDDFELLLVNAHPTPPLT